MKRIERLRLAQTNRPIDVVLHWHKSGDLFLDPEYQRGDVWGTIRRRNLIRSILLGIPIPSIIINDRFAAGWKDDNRVAVIDGKQRTTAILTFLTDKLEIPGAWFEMPEEWIRYSDLGLPFQRFIRTQPIPFTEGQLASIDDEIEVFELVNYGGVPQGESDNL